MQQPPKFTTTEKLVVARAITLYGTEDEKNVTNYIATMYNYIHPVKWKKIYESILNSFQESKDFTTLLDYCENLRLTTIQKLYKEKVELRNKILEGGSIPNFDESNGTDQNIGSIDELVVKYKNKPEIKTEKPQVYPPVDISLVMGQVEAVKKIQTAPAAVSVAEEPIKPKDESSIPLNINKEQKRYYYKMTDEEKELDDFIDRVGEEEYNSPIQRSLEPNVLRAKYPRIEPSIHRILEQTPTESVVERPPTPVQTSLEDEYKAICAKILNTRRQARDKSNMNDELVILIKYFSKSLENSEKLLNFVKEVKNTNIFQIILDVMMFLQNIINDVEDNEIITKCAEYKKILASFTDYYNRK